MPLRIVVLGTLLLSTPPLSAEDTPVSSSPAIPRQSDARSTQDASTPPSVQSKSADSDGAANIATRDAQLLLLQQKRAELDRLQREVEQLRVATGTARQVLVKVQLLEVSLTKLRNIGTDTEWFVDGYVNGERVRRLLNAAQGRIESPMSEQAAVSESNDILRFVEWLKRNNLAKVFSEPTLVTLSGLPASIHSGGEFPVPSKDDSIAPVDFRSFGTTLDILPLLLGDDRIRLEVNTGVSAIDYSHAIDVNGIRVPGLSVRRCDTTFELALGQTAALAGQVEKRTETRQLDDGRVEELPVDVGLMIVVTPELVPSVETPLANADHDVNSVIRR